MIQNLADLPYALTHLSPTLMKRQMTIHHGKHHAAYTNKLNQALEEVNFKVFGSLSC